MTILLAGVATAAFSQPCLAQDAPTSTAPPDGSATTSSTPPQTAPKPAQAVSEQEDTADIIVTAQKREQSLQDVSASISALSGDSIKNGGITNVEGLQTAVPNITIGDSFGFANLFIRGLGLNSVFANVDPSVTLYEDGAVISQPSAQLFSFFDLERIEVLRGPQGTLYGRNATGGTINLITAKPTSTFEGFIRAEAGSYRQLEAEGAVAGPITDSLLARVAFFTTTHDGYGKNVVTGNDVNDSSKQSVRGQLWFKPSTNFDFLLTGEYGRERDSANALFFKSQTFPGVLTDANPANDGLAAVGRGGFPTGGPRNYASTVDPSNDRKTWSVTGKAHWTLNDVFAITNILNYRKFDSTLVQDLDLSSVVTSSIQEFVLNSRHWSEEFQLNIDLDKLQVIAGAYYFNEKLHHTNSLGTSRFGDIYDPTAPGGGRRVHLVGDGKTETWALFWNANYALTDQLSLKAGGRYTTDTRTIDNTGYIFVAPGVQRVFLGPDGKKTFRDYTNEAGLEYRPTRDIMLYYSYSEGFKAGTGQLGVTAGSIIKPEQIKNHEVWVKSEFGRLILNVSAYTYKIKDVQLDQTLPGGPAGFITVFQNATSQKSYGVELDATWRPSSVFRTNLSFAYQHTEFGHFLSVNPANAAQVPEDIFGNRARNAPEFVGALHGEYDIPTANGGKFTLGGDASYKSKVYFSEFNDPLLSERGYALFDAHLRYTFPGGKLQASIWGKNLTNQLVESANFAVSLGRVTARTFIPPRTFGGTLRYNF